MYFTIFIYFIILIAKLDASLLYPGHGPAFNLLREVFYCLPKKIKISQKLYASFSLSLSYLPILFSIVRMNATRSDSAAAAAIALKHSGEGFLLPDTILPRK